MCGVVTCGGGWCGGWRGVCACLDVVLVLVFGLGSFLGVRWGEVEVGVMVWGGLIFFLEDFCYPFFCLFWVWVGLLGRLVGWLYSCFCFLDEASDGL